MAEREQIKKPAQKRDDAEEIEEAPATSERGEKIKAELDDLLDEIDDVLETNAEDFVKILRAEGWPISDKQLPVTPGSEACRMEPSKACWVCGEHEAARPSSTRRPVASTAGGATAGPASRRPHKARREANPELEADRS